MADTNGSLALDVDIESPARARADVGPALLDAGCDERLVRDVLIVISELVMNAILHGGGDADGRVHVRWEVVAAADGRPEVGVEVRDAGGGGTPRVHDVGVADAGGRGLALVDRLAASWSVDQSDGTVVRAVLSTP